MTRVPRSLAVVLILVLASCGGSSDDGDDGESSCIPPFSLTLSGTWFFVDQVVDNECNTTGAHQGSLLVAQTEELLTFFGAATTWQVTLCGSRATLNGRFSAPSNGGLHTVTSMLIQFQNENSATGSTNWEWKNDYGQTCSGTSTFNLTR